jgi:hypothetical protein
VVKHTCSQVRADKKTNKQTNKQTNGQHTTPQLTMSPLVSVIVGLVSATHSPVDLGSIGCAPASGARGGLTTTQSYGADCAGDWLHDARPLATRQGRATEAGTSADPRKCTKRCRAPSLPSPVNVKCNLEFNMPDPK